ncbi:unnamed protein product [Amoebophrya sp. A25]|nr:unnamed protein product [Amoebophrya sp. A25]|eukprot:GSA25T00026629001.1
MMMAIGYRNGEEVSHAAMDMPHDNFRASCESEQAGPSSTTGCSRITGSKQTRPLMLGQMRQPSPRNRGSSPSTTQVSPCPATTQGGHAAGVENSIRSHQEEHSRRHRRKRLRPSTPLFWWCVHSISTYDSPCSVYLDSSSSCGALSSCGAPFVEAAPSSKQIKKAKKASESDKARPKQGSKKASSKNKNKASEEKGKQDSAKKGKPTSTQPKKRAEQISKVHANEKSETKEKEPGAKDESAMGKATADAKQGSPSGQTSVTSALWDAPDFRDSVVAKMTLEGEKKVAWLGGQTTHCSGMLLGGDTSGCGMISEIKSQNDYARLVLQAPRPYHLFILFSMNGCCNLRKGHCNGDCGRAETAFRKVAASYHVIGEHAEELRPSDGNVARNLEEEGAEEEQRLNQRDVASSASEDDDKDERIGKLPAFFAIVHCDNEEMRGVCMKGHKLDTVPKVVHIRGRGSPVFRKAKGSAGLLVRKEHTFPQPVDWSDGEEMLRWAQSFASRGPQLKLYQDLVAKLRLMAPLLAIGVGAIAVLLLGAALVRLMPFLMVMAACGVQWLGCSGLTYNLLHGMNWRGERGEFVSNNSRSQYLTEGLACSGLFMLGGFSFVLALKLASASYKTARAASAGTAACAVAILLSMGAISSLMEIYRTYKANWLQEPGMMPPAGYKTGPVEIDRGLTAFGDINQPARRSEADTISGTRSTSLLQSLAPVLHLTARGWAWGGKNWRTVAKQGRKVWRESHAVKMSHKVLTQVFDYLVCFPVESFASALANILMLLGYGPKAKAGDENGKADSVTNKRGSAKSRKKRKSHRGR